MINITYYTGAGASANVLPTINGLNRSLNNIQEHYDLTDKSKFKDFSCATTFHQDLIWLIKESQKHLTVDTLARRLYLTGEIKLLIKLKKVLSVAFYLWQYKKYFDLRYDALLASLLDRPKGILKIPEQIKFITWNYDIQLELAAENYFRNLEIEDLQEEIGSFPRYEYSNGSHSLYNIVHLNGIAGFFRQLSGFNNLFSITQHLDDYDALEAALQVYKTDNKHANFDELFSFCWEVNNPISDKSFSIAKQIAEATQILVIIGYSFPFFNRTYDREIFNKMKQSGRLNKIYFQNPDLDGSFLRAQFNLSEKFSIIHIKDTQQFFIPHEL